MFDDLFIWAQIMGALGLLANVISWQIKKPRHIILATVPCNILWASHYAMLGAPLGAIANLCSCFKNLGLAFVQDRLVPYIIYGSILLTWGIGLYFYEFWYDILPLFSIAILNLGLLFRDNRPLIARTTLIHCTFGLVYDSIVGSYVGFFCGVFIMVSALIGMYRYENWEIGKCYKTFIPSLTRSLLFSSLKPTL